MARAVGEVEAEAEEEAIHFVLVDKTITGRCYSPSCCQPIGGGREGGVKVLGPLPGLLPGLLPELLPLPAEATCLGQTLIYLLCQEGKKMKL